MSLTERLALDPPTRRRGGLPLFSSRPPGSRLPQTIYVC